MYTNNLYFLLSGDLRALARRDNRTTLHPVLFFRKRECKYSIFLIVKQGFLVFQQIFNPSAYICYMAEQDLLVKHSDDDKKGTFYIDGHNRRIAEMTYTYAGEGKFIIEHTEVDPAYEGHGLAKELLKAAIAFAREKNYKIIPLCPYAKAAFAKTTDYNDVLNS